MSKKEEKAARRKAVIQQVQRSLENEGIKLTYHEISRCVALFQSFFAKRISNLANKKLTTERSRKMTARREELRKQGGDE